MSRQRIKLEGTQVGNWKVLTYLGKNNKKSRYSALCTSCNTVHNVNGQDMRNGRSKQCKKCAIVVGAKTRTGITKAKYSVKEMSERYLFTDKKKSATKRKILWKLTLAQFVDIIYKNCAYCGTPPKRTVNSLSNHNLASYWVENGDITYNGIDRVDSDQNYTPENVVTCCATCNKAKLDMTHNQFLAWIKQVHTHLFT